MGLALDPSKPIIRNVKCFLCQAVTSGTTWILGKESFESLKS